MAPKCKAEEMKSPAKGPGVVTRRQAAAARPQTRSGAQRASDSNDQPAPYEWPDPQLRKKAGVNKSTEKAENVQEAKTKRRSPAKVETKSCDGQAAKSEQGKEVMSEQGQASAKSGKGKGMMIEQDEEEDYSD